jgi:hypothetical protein
MVGIASGTTTRCRAIRASNSAVGGQTLWHLHGPRDSIPGARFGRIQRAMRRLLTTFTSAILLLLVLAPVALAETENDGRGFYGATNDKVVTNAGFILIIFFPTFVFVMSMLQKHLDKRKEARKAAQKAHAGNAQWRGGW